MINVDKEGRASAHSRMVLLVEGDSMGLLHDLSRPEKSDACSTGSIRTCGAGSRW
jgi:hypothetical protein